MRVIRLLKIIWNDFGGFSIRVLARTIGFLILLAFACSGSAHAAAAPPKMRPYIGIGIFILQVPDSDPGGAEPLHMYEEPGIFRHGEFDRSGSTANEWIFGVEKGRIPLVVMARKGNWLKVCYDDAGREAWIDPQHRGTFKTWEQFMRGEISRLLPALRKQYYQIYRQPSGDPLSTLTPKQMFKVIKLENNWAMIMSDQSTIGWLRWRDEDGRLLVGFGTDIKK